MKIPIIKSGLENNISDISSIDDIEYPLFNANDLIMKDFKRIGRNTAANFDEDSESENLQRPAPEFNHDKCIKCKKCIDICPANALTLKDNKVVLTESKCIRCYCCHEVCPVNAISIQH
jgi:ferredoxin